MVDSYLLDRDRGMDIVTDDPVRVVEYPMGPPPMEERGLYMYGQPWS